LASTIHDPEKRLEHLIKEVGEELRTQFRTSLVVYTPKTHHDEVSQLKELGCKTYKADETIANTYQIALEQACKPRTRILYCDLDRALHWMKAYPSELARIIKTPMENDFVLLGRTKRAFYTHPETQTLTEGIGNKITSKLLDFTDTRDVLGTTWLLTPDLAKQVLEIESSNQYGFYAEWPITLWRSAQRPKYVEAEGLEWETPDRFGAEIKAQGFKKWKLNFQTAFEWRKRTEMLRGFIESSLKYT
jgi:hypothetical protein